MDDIQAAVDLLTESGYIVFKVPPCELGDALEKARGSRGHGRHVLKTRSAVCEGEEPMPHGFHTFNMGTFGGWIYCACGRSFADYSSAFGDDDDAKSPWELHKDEFGISG